MYITEIEITLLVGVIISLLFSEKFGILAGGLITPAYIAMYFNGLNGIETVVIIYLISFITFLLVKFVLPKFVILYGRRLFVACIIIAIILKIISEFLFPLLPFEVFEFRGLSIIVPALLANTYCKQGVKITFVTSLLLSLLIFGISTLIYMI